MGVIIEAKHSFQMEMLDENMQLLLNHVADGVYLVDQNRRIQYWNAAATLITGFSEEEIMGSFCHNNILNHMTEDGVKLCVNGCPLHETLQDGVIRSATVYLHHKQGQRVKVDIQVLPLYREGKVVGAAEIFAKSKNRAEYLDLPIDGANGDSLEHIRYMALHDPLTLLPNRRFLESALKKRIAEAKKEHKPLGVLFIDIDHFNEFNNRYGHNTGDKILRALAESFSNALRDTDVIGRWGGEEFIALVEAQNEHELLMIAERVRMLSEHTVLRGKRELNATVSIGGTLLRPTDTAKTIIHRADQMMYESKLAGRNQVTVTQGDRKIPVSALDLL